MRIHPYPIDFESLDRGSVIEEATLRKCIPHEPGTDQWSFGVLSVKDELRKFFREERGTVVAIRERANSLEILTHEQTHAYVEQRERAALREYARRHLEDQHIDASQLSAEAKARRTARLTKSAWLLQQARRRKLPTIEEEAKKKLA